MPYLRPMVNALENHKADHLGPFRETELSLCVIHTQEDSAWLSLDPWSLLS